MYTDEDGVDGSLACCACGKSPDQTQHLSPKQQQTSNALSDTSRARFLH